jgi:hypothetical protein
MNVEFMAVCDYAVVTPDQKLTMVGTFDRLNAPQVPVTLSSLGVAARMRDVNVRAGRNHHEFEIRIKGPDSKILASVAGGMEAQIPIAPEGGLSLPIGMMFHGLVFPKYGEYRVELWLDKERAFSLPVWVTKPPNAQGEQSHPGGQHLAVPGMANFPVTRPGNRFGGTQ